MKSQWKKISQGLVLGAALAVAGTVQAGTGAGDGSVGLGLGWVKPKGIDGRIGFGVDGQYFVIDSLAVGAYLSYNSADSVSFLPFGLTVNYYLPQVEGLYFGANVGMVRGSVDMGPLGDVSSTELSFGGQVGYDFAITPEFSAGASYQYMWINTDPESGYAHNIFASAKYWF